MSVGILDQSMVHPREVFRAALLCNAAVVIVAHNHPSGNTSPSAEDVNVTRRLVDAGRLLGIEVQDSLVVSDTGWYSMKREGRM